MSVVPLVGRRRAGYLLSFAAITDERPPEVADAGYDRCIIPINPNTVHLITIVGVMR